MFAFPPDAAVVAEEVGYCWADEPTNVGDIVVECWAKVPADAPLGLCERHYHELVNE